MMQEQLSNNRIIAELDAKKQVQAVCTSSTADNKSRTVVSSVSILFLVFSLIHTTSLEFVGISEFFLLAMGIYG